jgi:signal transduction histidine kinase
VRADDSIEARAAKQAARTVQARLPRALAVTQASFLLVALLELYAHPERARALAGYLPVALLGLTIGTYVACRPRASPARVFGAVAAALVIFVAACTAYFITVGGQSETLALGLVYLAVGAMMVLPWGAGPQSVVVVAAAAGYSVAAAAGLPTTTPISIQVVGMISFAWLTIASSRSLARQHLDLLRRDAEKEALLEIARDLSGTISLDEILRRVQSRTAGVLGCQIVATYLPNAQGDHFHLAAAHGIPDELLDVARSVDVPRDQTIFAVAPRPPRKTVFIDDPERWPILRPEVVQRFGVRSLLVSALSLGDKELGLFVAARCDDQRSTAPQAQLFESIARQLSIALEAHEHLRQQQEDAQVATALARIGRELISALDTRALLERLCRVSAAVLDCDTSHALLRDKATGAFIIRGGHGDAPGRAERMRALAVPAEEIEQHTALFRDVNVVLVGGSSPTPIPPNFDTAVALVIAIRRGPDLVGLVTVGRRRPRPFGTREERIAGGIAQLASLALENARLMEELDTAHRVKTEFVANMSHELRTPLNVIIGYNDLLAEKAFGELLPEQDDIVERVGRRARELLELVNVTLDLSRIEAGDVPLARRELSIANLLHDLELETQMTRKKPKVDLHWHSATNLPNVLTDPGKLRLVVRNVVMNALKFTDHGRIAIEASGVAGGVEIAVKDTGIGIPPEMLAAIFEPFRQVDGTPGRGGGVGLGLHLSRRLLTMLGGRIEVESELGVGSTFRIWVPVKEREEEATDEHG